MRLQIVENETLMNPAVVRECARDVTPPIRGVVRLVIRYAKHFRGYSYALSYPPLVRLWIPRKFSDRPHQQICNKPYLPFLTLDDYEMFHHFLAHELRHVWQGQHTRLNGGLRLINNRGRLRVASHKRLRQVWGARGMFSERECDAYAIRVVRRLRRDGLQQANLEGAFLFDPEGLYWLTFDDDVFTEEIP